MTLESLCGIDSLKVVFSRFSNGIEVVRCILDFCKEVAEVEQVYSNSIQKFMRSTSYTFHSNILMKWLGSDPYQELGTLKYCWQRLGAELGKLAELHAEKATAYLEDVRKPLLELLPQLEQRRKDLKIKMLQLRSNVELAQKKHAKEKQKYFALGDAFGVVLEKLTELQQSSLITGAKLKKLEARRDAMSTELAMQEVVYDRAHASLVETHEDFDRAVLEMYKEIERYEVERVSTVKKCMQVFGRTLSNTVPAYLEGMQQIVLSVDEIDAASDIESFVALHSELKDPPVLPDLERHATRLSAPSTTPFTLTMSSCSNNAAKQLEDSMENGQRTPLSENSSKEEEEEEEEEEGEEGEGEGTSDGQTGSSEEEDLGSESESRSTSSVEAPTGKISPKGSQNRPRGNDKPLLASKPVLQEAKAKNVSTDKTPNARTREEPKKENNNVTSSSESGSDRSHVASIVQRITASESAAAPHKPSSTTSQPQRSTPSKPTTTADQHKLTAPVPVKPAILKPPSANERSIRGAASHSARDEASRTRTKSFPPPLSSSQQQQQQQQAKPPPPRSRTSTTVDTAGAATPDLASSQLLSELLVVAAANDYYALLGVGGGAPAEEVAKARRERSKQLHPDHFTSDPDKRELAEEQLVRINKVFQDVLKSPETRSLYDQLCNFRRVYPKTLHQKQQGLETAQGKLQTLHRGLKKAQVPLELLEEVQLVLRLIRTRLTQLVEQQQQQQQAP